MDDILLGLSNLDCDRQGRQTVAVTASLRLPVATGFAPAALRC